MVQVSSRWKQSFSIFGNHIPSFAALHAGSVHLAAHADLLDSLSEQKDQVQRLKHLQLVWRRQKYSLSGFCVVISRPAPLLKNAQLSDSKVRELYLQIIQYMRRMYQDARLVHADLSEFNMLYVFKLCSELWHLKCMHWQPLCESTNVPLREGGVLFVTGFCNLCNYVAFNPDLSFLCFKEKNHKTKPNKVKTNQTKTTQ